jgi:hypothetical protein
LATPFPWRFFDEVLFKLEEEEERSDFDPEREEYTTGDSE